MSYKNLKLLINKHLPTLNANTVQPTMLGSFCKTQIDEKSINKNYLFRIIISSRINAKLKKGKRRRRGKLWQNAGGN